MEKSSIHPFEFKKNQTISHFDHTLDHYEITIIDNPRTSNGDLGPIKCCFCQHSNSVLLEISSYIQYTRATFVICGGCLDKMNRLINWGYMEQIKKGRQDV